MAVFTTVSPEELSLWLEHYPVGTLQDLVPIAAGIENTNYFVRTTMGHYVLTIFEKLQARELPYYLGLMNHLAAQGLPCPAPLPNRQHRFHALLKGKPTSLVTRLSGQSQTQPTARHCAALGHMMARMHQAALTFEETQSNPRGQDWRIRTAQEVRTFLTAAQQTLLDRALAQAVSFDATLPQGPVHADLFRDNVLFEGERISGLIDFYFAGTDNWAYDLAIVANDWCMTPQACLDPLRLSALLGAYHEKRALTTAEIGLWPRMLGTAALRFWLSRLHDQFQPRPGSLLNPHDPAWFERILSHHLEQPCPWPL
ncbi:homoserine kinase [Ferrovum sp.]|uniref:homoserine kinase n=1 Tax=Ferrovum sp. TaxID=2609467 RepID=UPI00262849DA|nr:homoserine kinase [Ferrovum sp.]